jgi:hypothetical protein
MYQKVAWGFQESEESEMEIVKYVPQDSDPIKTALVRPSNI